MQHIPKFDRKSTPCIQNPRHNPLYIMHRVKSAGCFNPALSSTGSELHVSHAILTKNCVYPHGLITYLGFDWWAAMDTYDSVKAFHVCWVSEWKEYYYIRSSIHKLNCTMVVVYSKQYVKCLNDDTKCGSFMFAELYYILIVILRPIASA